MVGRGAINFTDRGHGVTYFFDNDKYVWCNWTPGKYDDNIGWGPTHWDWVALIETKFPRVDAILPCPGEVNRGYFFCGDQYARIQFTPRDGKNQKLLGGVRPLSEWHSLVKAGFDRVDAAMIVPGTTDQAYFFSRNEFCRVSFKEGSAAPDELLEGPFLIRERWPNLGFKTIDTIIPDPSSPNQAYVFSGDKAARIALVVGGGVDVKTGPMNAAEYWKSLHGAGFY
ncbi:hemopexin domain protein [Ceratobasidium sp. AG-Ba]|nr:hemopexin domain protein [Ceratobasidium sp. AG-Ba]QRW04760.1 hemopexin domain protein [Ceratobasidium sp. AG-Ba]